MAYTIKLTNGTQLLSLADGTSDTSTSMALIGRNYAGYGTALNSNFVHLLENASSPTAPSNPLVGQLWWDSQGRHLNIWQGTNWKVISSSLTGSVAPANPVTGDFWWNTATNQLYVYGTSQWGLVGPPTAAGTPVTTVVADSVSDGVTQHTVGDLYVNNKLVAVYSTDNTSYVPAASYNGLTTIYPGMNVLPGYSIVGSTILTTNLTTANATVSTQLTTNKLTVTSGLMLSANIVSLLSSSVSATSLTVSNVTTLNAVGAGAVTAASLNVTGTTTLAGVSVTSISASGLVNAATLQQGGSGVLTVGNYNSYSPTLTGTGANGTWGINISGLAAEASSVYSQSTGDYRQGYTNATAYSIAQRDSGGNLTSNYFYGIATQAEYADLAERFESDTAYPVGTVMELGGSAEVTACSTDASENVFGVISTAPAYLMNRQAGSDETHPAIALSGRVPVRVTGVINKGDRLVSAGNGLARSATRSEITAFNVIGRALASKAIPDEGVIEAIVRVAI